jgi:activator of 2-hydroxyglutaryl-CoA dehydratase
VRTLETELGVNVLVPEVPQISAAIGAALLGQTTC